MGKRNKKKTGSNKSGIQKGLSMEPDDKIPIEECPGTFRWGSDKQFLPIPKFPTQTTIPLGQVKGWAEYLVWRGGKDFMISVREDPSLIDCLSFPITILSMMSCLKLEPGKNLDLVLLGVSRRAEELTCRKTDVWKDISYFFPETNIRMYFVGPETSENCRIACSAHNMECYVVKGTLGDLRTLYPNVSLHSDNTLFTVFNGGFGNFAESNRYELLWSWLPDLEFLVRCGSPVFFTCANDYGDVKGEVAVMKVLNALLILPPQENKFSFATTLVGEDDSGWSRGNSFIYAVCGCGVNDFGQVQDVPGRQRLVLKAMLSNESPMTGEVVSWGATHQVGPVTTHQINETPHDRYTLSKEDRYFNVVIKTQGLTSMTAASLTVYTRKVELSWTDQAMKHDIVVDLPLPVESSAVRASFSKRRQALSIQLPYSS